MAVESRVISEIDSSLVRWNPDNELTRGALYPQNRIDDMYKSYWPNLVNLIKAASGLFEEGWNWQAAYASGFNYDDGSLDSHHPSDGTKLSIVYENLGVSGLTIQPISRDYTRCLQKQVLDILNYKFIHEFNQDADNYKKFITPLIRAVQETPYSLVEIEGEFNHFRIGEVNLYQTGVFVLELGFVDARERLGPAQAELRRGASTLKILSRKVNYFKSKVDQTGDLFPVEFS